MSRQQLPVENSVLSVWQVIFFITFRKQGQQSCDGSQTLLRRRKSHFTDRATEKISPLWRAVAANVTQRRNLLHIVVDIYLAHVLLAACVLFFVFPPPLLSRNGLLLAHRAGWEMQVRCFDNAITVAKTCHFFFYAPPLPFSEVHIRADENSVNSKGRRRPASCQSCIFLFNFGSLPVPNLWKLLSLYVLRAGFCSFKHIFRRDAFSHP